MILVIQNARNIFYPPCLLCCPQPLACDEKRTPVPIGQSCHMTREAILVGFCALQLPGASQLEFSCMRYYSNVTDRKG